MKHENLEDKATMEYERSMEVVYDNVDKAKDKIEKLSAFVDDLLPFLDDKIGDDMIELIEGAFQSISNIQ